MNRQRKINIDEGICNWQTQELPQTLTDPRTEKRATIFEEAFKGNELQ